MLQDIKTILEQAGFKPVSHDRGSAREKRDWMQKTISGTDWEKQGLVRLYVGVQSPDSPPNSPMFHILHAHNGSTRSITLVSTYKDTIEEVVSLLVTLALTNDVSDWASTENNF